MPLVSFLVLPLMESMNISGFFSQLLVPIWLPSSWQALFVLVIKILQPHPYPPYGDQAVTSPVKTKNLFAQKFDESQLEGYGLQPNLPLCGDQGMTMDWTEVSCSISTDNSYTAKYINEAGVCQGKNSWVSVGQLHYLMYYINHIVIVSLLLFQNLLLCVWSGPVLLHPLICLQK